jgi:outer membrane protein TolC
MKTKLIFLTFFFALNAQALTFEEALQQASDNSHELKQMRLEADSAHWGKRKEQADFLPKVEADGRHVFDERWEELAVPFNGALVVMPAIQPYTSLGFTAKWNIFNGFKDWNEVKAADLEQQAASYRLKRAEEQKRAEIRTLFYRALGAQLLVEVADQNIHTLETHLNDVQIRVANGVSTKFDSLRSEVLLEEARTEKVLAENAVAITRAKLYEAMSIPDDGQVVQGTLPSDFSRIDLKKISLDISSRNDRMALFSTREVSKLLTAAAKSHWVPQVALFGNYEYYNNYNHAITQDDEKFKSAYALGVQMSWNLFDGGADYAKQKQAALNQQVNDEKLAKLDESMPVALEEAKRRFNYDVINFKAKLSSIRKAEEAVRLARGGLKAGIRTNTEVLDAVVDLNRARAAALKSQIDAIEALGLLELSVGHAL